MTISSDPYFAALANGCSHRLAEMLASRQGPYIKSDSVGFRGVASGDPMQGIPKECQRAYLDKARRAGVSVKGKKYLAGLAQFPGDPEAWVSSRSEAKRVIEKHGMSSEGLVTVKGREQQSDLPVVGPPAPDIVERRAMDIAQRDGCDGKLSLREWNDYKDKALGTLT